MDHKHHNQQLVHALMEQLEQLPPVDPKTIKIIPVEIVGYSANGKPPYSHFNLKLEIQDATRSRTVWSGSFMISHTNATDHHGHLKSLSTILTDIWTSPEVQIRARRILHSDKINQTLKPSSPGPLFPDSNTMLGLPWAPPAL